MNLRHKIQERKYRDHRNDKKETTIFCLAHPSSRYQDIFTSAVCTISAIQNA